MAISGIGIVGSSPAAQSASLNLTQKDFLSVLITQLQYQDPLQPMNDEQFLGQLAQFSALEVATQQSTQLDTLITFNSMNQAISLVGKTVAVNQSGSTAPGGQSIASGTVTAVDFSTGAPLLTVKTSTTTLTDVSPSNVTLIQQ